MDYIADSLDALRLVDLGATLAIAAYLWLRRRHDRNAARIGEIEERVIAHEQATADKFARGDNRITVLESHLPSREQVSALSESIAGLKGELRGISNLVGIIHQHLLEKSK